MEIKCTDEQEAILSVYANRQQHILVKSIAGSGKSTLIRSAAMRHPDEKRGILTFGKRDQETMEASIKKHKIANTTVRTVHSIGYEMCSNHWQENLRPTLMQDVPAWRERMLFHRSAFDDNDKFWKRIEKGNPRSRIHVYNNKIVSIYYDCAGYESWQHKKILKLANFIDIARCEMIAGNFDEIDRLRDLSDEHEYDWTDRVLYEALGVIAHSNFLYDMNGVIDYTDMLIQPLRHGIETPSTFRNLDRLISDELQDWNEAQRQIASRFIGPNTLFFGVGDPMQEIYGFRGANESFAKTEHMMANIDQRDLYIGQMTYSFRCPQSHAEKAQEFVPQFKAMPSNPRGDIKVVDFEHVADLIQEGDIYYARRNAPLIKLTIDIVIRYPEKGAKMLGSDLDEKMLFVLKEAKSVDRNLVNFSTSLDCVIEKQADINEKWGQTKIAQYEKRVRKIAIATIRREHNLSDEQSTAISEDMIQEKVNTLTTRYESSTQKKINERNENFHDVAMCVSSVVHGLSPRSYDHAKELIQGLFSSTGGLCTGGSIHKMKGREAERTFYIDYDYAPPKKANLSESELEEENRIRYVGFTRSLDTMYLVPTAQEAPAEVEITNEEMDQFIAMFGRNAFDPSREESELDRLIN